MEEEEHGPLIEFEDTASPDEQADVASRFASFEIEHAGARDISLEDKDPDGYLADNS